MNDMLPVSEVLSHIAQVTSTAKENGREFQCVAIMLVDADGKWAGVVGGVGQGDLSKLLLTARDSVVRGDNGFTVFSRQVEAPSVNGHDRRGDGH